MPSRRKLRVDDLLRFKLLDAVAISPDGERVVYALRTMDPKENRYQAHLWLVPARGGRPRQLTQGDRVDSSPVWSPDGRAIAFLSSRDKKTQVCLLPADGGEARALTDMQGSFANLAFSPAGGELLFLFRPRPQEDPAKRAKGATFKHITTLSHKLDGYGYFLGRRQHLYACSARSGRTRQLTRGDYDVLQASWSPDGRRIAFLADTNAATQHDRSWVQIHVVAARGGRPRAVTTRQGYKDWVEWAPEGRSLLYIGHSGKTGEWIRHPFRIREVGLREGGERDLTPWMDDWPFNDVISDTVTGAAYVIHPYREDGRRRLAFVLNERGGCRLWSIPREGARRRDEARLEFGGDVNVYAFSANAEGRAAVASSTMMDLGEVYALRLDGAGAARRLTRGNAALLDGLRLTAPEEMTFRCGERRIQGWVIKPPGLRAGSRCPLLLQIHGGPMAQYGYVFFHEMHLLAAQGWAVAFTNPSGSSGYGTEWVRSIQGRWGERDYADIMAVAARLARLPWVDARRMGVLGGSYGGFMTTWILGHSRRFKAGVTMRQAGNRIIQAGASDFGWYEYHHFKGFPWDKPMAYLRRSPNFYAHRIRAPLLIVHSEEDLRCPVSQADELFTILKYLGRTVEYVRFEGESHGLSRGGRPQNRTERLRRIVDWFARHL